MSAVKDENTNFNSCILWKGCKWSWACFLDPYGLFHKVCCVVSADPPPPSGKMNEIHSEAFLQLSQVSDENCEKEQSIPPEIQAAESAWLHLQSQSRDLWPRTRAWTGERCWTWSETPWRSESSPESDLNRKGSFRTIMTSTTNTRLVEKLFQSCFSSDKSTRLSMCQSHLVYAPSIKLKVIRILLQIGKGFTSDGPIRFIACVSLLRLPLFLLLSFSKVTFTTCWLKRKIYCSWY